MSFFKDFKDDLSQAVNELMPEDDFESDFDDEEMVDTLEKKETAAEDDDLEAVGDLFDSSNAQEPQEEEVPIAEPESVFNMEIPAEEPAEEPTYAAPSYEPEPEPEPEPVYEPEPEPAPVYEPVYETETETTDYNYFEKEETTKVDTTMSTPELGEATNTITVITNGTRVIGSIESEGSVEVDGIVEGNIICNGKITVTGAIKGDTTSAEFFADSAKLEGEVKSTGTVKVGLGSVIVGNIGATSAVIAGAVKGDIDVQGPVVVDTSAVVMGNIKSRSVQINNGAVIEGFCSQCYADIDVKGIFGDN